MRRSTGVEYTYFSELTVIQDGYTVVNLLLIAVDGGNIFITGIPISLSL